MSKLLGVILLFTLYGLSIVLGQDVLLPTVSVTWSLLTPTITLPPGVNSSNTPTVGSHGPIGRCDTGVIVERETNLYYLFGGLTELGTVADSWLFDPKHNSWVLLQPSGDVPTARVGMAYEFLPDFDQILIFGGTGGPNNVYLDDIYTYHVHANTFTQLVAPSADGHGNPGPFARAYAGWRRTSFHAIDQLDGTFYYELVLYGGSGDSISNGGSGFDVDQDDLWSYRYSNISGVFSGQWIQQETARVCWAPFVSCTDSISEATRSPGLGTVLQDLSVALGEATYRPSTLVNLLGSLRTISTNLNSSAYQAKNDFYSLPADQQVDSNTSCTTLCEAYTFDTTAYPTHPFGMEGMRGSLYNNTLVYFGGYACLSSGYQIQGGAGCYSFDLWFLDLTTFTWTTMTPNFTSTDPAIVQQTALWPNQRAYHSQVIYQNRLFIYGGGYKGGPTENGGILIYYNDLSVFDLNTLLWLNVNVQGNIPRPGWSSSLVGNNGLGYLFGGCTDDAYYDSVYELRFDQVVQPQNCKISGPGVELNITAGTPTYFIIETRFVNSDGSWGAILPWGTNQNFFVQLINEERGLTRATVMELGGGVYNVSYTLGHGYVFQLYISIGGTLPIAGSPFTIYNQPQPPAGSYIDVTGTPTIKGNTASVIVRFQDSLGNYIHSGGDINIAQSTQTNPRALGAGSTTGSNIVTLVTRPITNEDGSPSLPYPTGNQPNELTAVVDLGDGSYQLFYTTPIGSFDSYAAFIYWNFVLFGSEGPTQMPLIVRAYDEYVIQPDLIIASYTLTIICIVIVLIYMVILTIHSEARVVKASSYFFLMTLCAGALLCFIATFLLSVTNDDSCRAFPLVLGFGYNLLIGSLFVKSQRIMSIFTTKKLQVLNLSNLKTGIPILILLGMELIFSIAWLASDPMKHVGEPYIKNQYQTYNHCDCEHKNVWVFFTVLEKAALAFYGIYLATKTRNVPRAYNESKLMAFSLYNLAFTVLIGVLLIYLTQPDDDLNTPYITQVIVILWCCMWTVSSLIVPRIFYIYRPPGDDFFRATSRKSNTGLNSQGSARKLPGIDKQPSVSARPTASSVAARQLPSRPAATSTAGNDIELQSRGASSSIIPPTRSAAPSAVALPRKVSLIDINQHLPPVVDVGSLAESGMREHVRRESKLLEGTGTSSDDYDQAELETDQTGQPPLPTEPHPSTITNDAAREIDSDSSSDDETAPSETNDEAIVSPSDVATTVTDAPPAVTSPFALRSQTHRPSISGGGALDFPSIQPRPPAHSISDEPDPFTSSSSSQPVHKGKGPGFGDWQPPPPAYEPSPFDDEDMVEVGSSQSTVIPPVVPGAKSSSYVASSSFLPPPPSDKDYEL